MSIVFKDYKTGETKMFRASGVIRIEPYNSDLVEIELRSGEKFKTEYVRFYNQ